MTRVAILGDSHVPFREDEVPEQVWEDVRESDLTVHMGDFDSRKALEEFVEECQAMIAVRGNMDPSSVELEEAELFDLEDVTFFVSHGTDGRRQVQEHAEYNDADVAVFGHTHQVYDEVDGGVHMLNPGTCTGADPAEDTTYMVAEVEDGEYEVELLEVEDGDEEPDGGDAVDVEDEGGEEEPETEEDPTE